MKNINSVLLIYCLVLFQCCSKKVEVEASEFLNTINISKQFLTSDLPTEFQFSALDTVDLEIPGNPALTGFTDFAFAKDFFLILDVRQGLLKFDYEGNYLKTIGAKGQGPDEYDVATSIYLDEKDDIILITDWGKRSVVSYDHEGNFIASEKFPGLPIFLFEESDSLLLIQEDGLESLERNRMNLIVSSIYPKTLAHMHQKGVLYSYGTKGHSFYYFPKILTQSNETTLFYFPRSRYEGLIDHKDTIYRKVENRLVPEYLLHFTEFDKTDTLSISRIEIFDGYASLLLGYKRKGYMVILDLENNLPLSYLGHSVHDNLSELNKENFPKHINENVFYVILRDNEGGVERNPIIVFYRFDN